MGIENTQILRRNLETSVVEFRTDFFNIEYLNLFCLLHSGYVKLKHKPHCFPFTFSLFIFNSKVNIACLSPLLNLQIFSFSSSFFLVCYFSYHKEAWKFQCIYFFIPQWCSLHHTSLWGQWGPIAVLQRLLVTCPATSVAHGIRQSANEKELNDTTVKPPPLEHVTPSAWIYVVHWRGVFPLFCLESQL